MTLLSAAATLARRFPPTATRTGILKHASSLVSSRPVSHHRSANVITNIIPGSSGNHVQDIARSFSTVPPTAPPSSSTSYAKPPDSLTPEAGLAAQDAMKLFIEHGVGKRRLEAIAADKKKGETSLIQRWQGMVQIYLETQCHVIALLGYTPDDRGITLYTHHLSNALRLSPPDQQEELRKSGRDTYRMVLEKAFDLPLLEEQSLKGELSIVDARNIMHKVSMKMQDPEVLEKVARACSVSVAMNDSLEAKQLDMARKHTVVQEVMVSDVYMSGNPSIVKESGFGDGEDGYVRMQCAMAEHQGDPLITQYVGTAMIRLLQSAGIDTEAMQNLEAMAKQS